ncbi:MAG: tRNA 2-thiouridine(34) synthase MnmA [Deltaproteobacteria bacterium]|nr:tRNA 2-thiouridine(34) synthase MnmA [Deltaproteobacteria bacterium]
MSRIAVALSGGVDSSVAAALLCEAGHEVIGLTLKVWDSSRCCSLDDAEDARRVAWHLGIRFYVLNAAAPFEAAVVGPFVGEYGAGRTPNPCILCNRRLKFRWLLDRVRALGCDALATGHYARVEGDPGQRVLRKGIDPAKDQSYFLVPERPDILDHLVFPLGGRTKPEVRAEAERRGLPVARKAESQDACFVPEGGLAAFLAERLGPDRPGEIVDRAGRRLGWHAGLNAYTVGQRKGLGLAAPEPLYVVAREPQGNRLVVGPREAAMASALTAEDPVWLAHGLPERFDCAAKIRSTGRAAPCNVAVAEGRVHVRFAEPQFGVAPGQMVVFYDGDRVLGGAWIGEARGDG